MKILIVCNNAYTRGNGLYTALQSLIGNLKDEDLDVRILATENENPESPQPDYPLKHFRFQSSASTTRRASLTSYVIHISTSIARGLKWKACHAWKPSVKDSCL